MSNNGLRGFSYVKGGMSFGVNSPLNFIYQLGDYEIAIFTVSGILYIGDEGFIDILAVGGGGGSGGANYTYVAGGGGGEVLFYRNYFVPRVIIPITIGIGGAAATSGTGTNGGNTIFGDLITARGGGAGYITSNGGNSGNGLFRGGVKNGASGGGGAGNAENGDNALSTNDGGDGGEGTAWDITGTSLFYGPGGGGSGNNGNRVGGTGYTRANSGAGGNGYNGAGKAGIVVVRRNLITPYQPIVF